MIDLSHIHNWIVIGGTSFLAIGIGMLFSKIVASKNIPILSTVAKGILSFWQLTVQA